MTNPTTATTMAAAENPDDTHRSRVDSRRPFADMTNDRPATSIRTNATM
jgi:hypothetical protein